MDTLVFPQPILDALAPIVVRGDVSLLGFIEMLDKSNVRIGYDSEWPTHCSNQYYWALIQLQQLNSSRDPTEKRKDVDSAIDMIWTELQTIIRNESYRLPLWIVPVQRMHLLACRDAVFVKDFDTFFQVATFYLDSISSADFSARLGEYLVRYARCRLRSAMEVLESFKEENRAIEYHKELATAAAYFGHVVQFRNSWRTIALKERENDNNFLIQNPR